MRISIGVVILLSIAFFQVNGLKYQIVETSNEGQNSILKRFNDQVTLTPIPGSNNLEFTLDGTCNSCRVSRTMCGCTKRACFRETLSESFICTAVKNAVNFGDLVAAQLPSLKLTFFDPTTNTPGWILFALKA